MSAGARVEIAMSKQFKDLQNPAIFEKRMRRFNEAMGNILLGRDDMLATGGTGIARIDPAPLQRSFGKFYKGNKRVAQFPKYAITRAEIKTNKKGEKKIIEISDYELEKKAKGLNNFLVYSGELYKDAVTHATMHPTPRGVTITARSGLSKPYHKAHQDGNEHMPQRSPYMIDETDKRSMVLPLTTILKALFRGSLSTVSVK